MDKRQRALAVGGVLAVAAAVVIGRSLAAEPRSPSSLGLPLLLALPGLGLVAESLDRFRWTGLLTIGSVATMLLGLDVTDSTRTLVVDGGYAVALVSVAACIALTVLPGRRSASG